ncbi:MAG: hypothetical protein KatS3mg105_0448 [Gemmatales bacterium]|nr:MAG: hypothetical protein KatS3mg105_0448 [Gemmatales bacterium]
MDGSKDLGDLETEKWERLQSLADRFEKAWQTVHDVQAAPELTQFLPPVDDPLRSVVLLELVKTDLEIRWRRGQPAKVEDYLRRFSELGTSDNVSAKLLYEEFRVRHRYGDRPSLDEYKNRFPTVYEEFASLVRDQPLPTIETPNLSVAEHEATRLDSKEDKKNVGIGLLTSGDFLAGFTNFKKIGSGGFGEVYQAEAPGGVPVAIKKIFRTIDHDESKRELESLELIKRLRHPFLLSTIAFAQREDRLFIVMELADGSLRDRLKECRKQGLTGIPVAELYHYFREAADALDYLHEQHVLHRDIKPDNILLVQKHAKLADFGLARLHESDRSVMASGSGTPLYMPPEVWRGKVSPASDQYSLAMTYCELRLDRRLFDTRDMLELMTAHLEKTPDLSPLPEAEQEVLLRALAKDHSQRFPTCRQFIEALGAALTNELGRGSGITLPLSLSEKSQTTDQSVETRTLGKPKTPSLEPTEVAPYASIGKDGAPLAWRSLPKTKPDNEAQKESLPVKPKRKRRMVLISGVVLLCAAVGALTIALWERTTPWLPKYAEPAPGATLVNIGGRDFYDQIDVVRSDGEVRVRFMLIPKKRVSDPATFYIMRDKVNVALFKRFAKIRPPKDDSWQTKGAVRYLENGNEVFLKADNDRLPVFNVFVEDAYLFAQWLGGDLPSRQQWDKAAGRFEPDAGQGPFQGSWDDTKTQLSELSEQDKKEIAIGRYHEGPLEAGAATRDVSIFGVRDMAGNGQEWTREIFAPLSEEQRVPLSNPKKTDMVYLRGRNYLFPPRPLFFSELNKTKPETEFYLKPSPTISFRVVIETE